VKACANEPKPPRVTPPEPQSAGWQTGNHRCRSWCGDDDPPDEPWPLLDENPRGEHPTAAGDAPLNLRQFGLGLQAFGQLYFAHRVALISGLPVSDSAAR
jgi:hypothetical protein